MLDSTQNEFLVSELDPILLSTPFKVQTNWHVITGASCCGKTTLIDLLSDKGFRTAAETAREYFEREMASGRTLEEIRATGAVLQRGIDKMQRRLEHRLRANEVIFLDRAFPDSLPFYRIVGMDPNEILAECFHHCYASIFLLDRLPFMRKKALGLEDDASATYIDEWLARDYSTLGYRVVRVPVLSPEDRVAFILERLTERGLL